ncbi:MAG: universal stress protein [Cellulomonadaceae bacterium]|jgi:nucleotide-binding universal stress UspA family protein|nr:universal stress protein [Cellulomonadaceae bacterium]
MTVLVACNASPHGRAALEAGVAEASRRRLPLSVLVLNPGAEFPSELAGPLDNLPESVDAPTVTFRDEHTEPSDAILDLADDIDATLIVLGVRKRSSQGTYVTGTTTQRILLDASAPVLLIKAEYDQPDLDD